MAKYKVWFSFETEVEAESRREAKEKAFDKGPAEVDYIMDNMNVEEVKKC